MHLNEAQQSVFFRIQARPELLSDFEVLCASFEAALDEVERPADLEQTNPFGAVAIRSADEQSPVEVTDGATVVAVAWLEMIARAVAEAGEISPDVFDEDGISLFCDTRPLFGVAKDCGIGPAHARRAFARVRVGEETAAGVPHRALKLLRGIGAIRRPRPSSRIVALKPCFAALLDRDEIARAKAGSLVYSLVARKDGYEAVRVRKKKVRQLPDSADVAFEREDDVMDGFSVPLVPCEELHGTALDHFIQFLDTERVGKKDGVYTCTYQRLVHRVVAA